MLNLCLLAILLLVGSASADFPAPPNALTYNDVRGRSYNVTYDSRSFIIDGRRTLLLGGAVHYPRIEPQRWHAVLQHMLDAGMNHVQLYTPQPLTSQPLSCINLTPMSGTRFGTCTSPASTASRTPMTSTHRAPTCATSCRRHRT